MLPNVTTAEAVVLSPSEYKRPRSRAVIVDGEFPGTRFTEHHCPFTDSP